MCKKNDRHVPVLGFGPKGKKYARIILSDVYRAFVALIAEEVRRLGVPQITSDRWSLTVYTTWPQLRHLDKTGDSSGDFPRGDSDASLSGVKDALQEAGVLADDVRFVSDRTFNIYEKDVRRVVAVLEPSTWDPMAPPDTYADLLTEVRDARQAPEYRQRTAEHLMRVSMEAAAKGKRKPRKAAAPKVKASKPAAPKVRKPPLRKPPAKKTRAVKPKTPKSAA
jgi:Holliday junction resolvase RusA-like endonuclease